MRLGEGLELGMMYFGWRAPFRTLQWLDRLSVSTSWTCSNDKMWKVIDAKLNLLSGGHYSMASGQHWACQMPCSDFWRVGARAYCLPVAAARTTSLALTCLVVDDPSEWMKFRLGSVHFYARKISSMWAILRSLVLALFSLAIFSTQCTIHLRLRFIGRVQSF